MKVLIRSQFVVAPLFVPLLSMSLLLVGFLTLSFLVYNPLPVYANDLPTTYALSQAMASMGTAMSGVPMTGDPDVDFAIMMIPHHQGAVEMAKVELQYGSDSRLKRLAQEIIVTQQSEIAVMQLVLEYPLSAQTEEF